MCAYKIEIKLEECIIYYVVKYWLIFDLPFLRRVCGIVIGITIVRVGAWVSTRAMYYIWCGFIVCCTKGKKLDKNTLTVSWRIRWEVFELRWKGMDETVKQVIRARVPCAWTKAGFPAVKYKIPTSKTSRYHVPMGHRFRWTSFYYWSWQHIYSSVYRTLHQVDRANLTSLKIVRYCSESIFRKYFESIWSTKSGTNGSRHWIPRGISKKNKGSHIELFLETIIKQMH